MIKFCTRCCKDKDISEFEKNKSLIGRVAYYYICHECHKEKKRKEYIKKI